MAASTIAALGVASTATGAEALLSLVRSELRPNSFFLRDAKVASTIDEMCASLEAEGTRPAWPRDLLTLDGRWRLVYSSQLARALPPLPLPDQLISEAGSVLSAVEQRVDVEQRRVVNGVSLSPWPAGSAAQLLSALPGPFGGAVAALQESVVIVELDHTFGVDGEGGSSGGRRQAAAGSVVELRLEQVRRTLSEKGSQEEVDPYLDMLNPQVRRQQQQLNGVRRGSALFDAIPKETSYDVPLPLTSFAAGSFDTPYIDERIRISRGPSAVPLGPADLRIFERVDQVGKKVYRSWQEEEDALAAAAAAGDDLAPLDDRWQEGGFEEAESMDFMDNASLDDNGCPDS